MERSGQGLGAELQKTAAGAELIYVSHVYQAKRWRSWRNSPRRNGVESKLLAVPTRSAAEFIHQIQNSLTDLQQLLSRFG